jgi:hypothetical protein
VLVVVIGVVHRARRVNRSTSIPSAVIGLVDVTLGNEHRRQATSAAALLDRRF